MTRIAFFSDTHISCEANRDQELYRRRLERVVTAINEADCELALCGGDLTEHPYPEEMQTVLSLLMPIVPRLRVVPGNHDIGNKPAPNERFEVRQDWLDVYEKTVGPCFFLERLPGVRIIGLAGSLFGSSLPRAEEQWHFLKAEAVRPPTVPSLLLVHYPPFLETPGEAGSYWNIDVEHRERLFDFCKSAGVRLVLSGHTHRPFVNEHEGIRLVATPPVSFNLTGAPRELGWTLVDLHPDGSVETEFRLVED